MHTELYICRCLWVYHIYMWYGMHVIRASHRHGWHLHGPNASSTDTSLWDIRLCKCWSLGVVCFGDFLCRRLRRAGSSVPSRGSPARVPSCGTADCRVSPAGGEVGAAGLGTTRRAATPHAFPLSLQRKTPAFPNGSGRGSPKGTRYLPLPHLPLPPLPIWSLHHQQIRSHLW